MNPYRQSVSMYSEKELKSRSRFGFPPIGVELPLVMNRASNWEPVTSETMSVSAVSIPFKRLYVTDDRKIELKVNI
ncbi:hypothetical protein TNCV_1269451 [Trichonephila clavipes]|nr:hypothetical protein TNCV_1269451 [Trichonephila clavipes]